MAKYLSYTFAALLSAIFLLPIQKLYAQTITGRVIDINTKQPLPFAIIKTTKPGSRAQGLIADLEGKFEINLRDNIHQIEVSYLGYETQTIKISLIAPYKPLTIALTPHTNILGEVMIRPPYNKIRRIINAAIANRDRNNPDKYDRYRCYVYYKMVADIAIPDSVLNKDTATNKQELKDILDNQHLLVSETYSIRTWQKPQHLQEDVLATRLSGFKKYMFTSLVTDVLPFHAYNDYLNLNGKDYHNPISRGFSQYYKFNLSDEILQGRDTVWILSFSPKKPYNNLLKGTVYINSDGYAIAYLLATAKDPMLKLSVRIEQQYQRLPYTTQQSRWFPQQLNYIINWQQTSNGKPFNIYMNGNSKIDSVTWNEDNKFHFDKTHTVKLQPGADMQNDSAWAAIRPVPLDHKELRTYKFMDSLGNVLGFDKITDVMRKLPEAKLPVGPVDIDLRRIFNANYYENMRFGLGLQTNEKVIKWLSVGGWCGYGIKDAHWKYGAFAEAYLDRYKEFVIRFAYDNDIKDPGRVQLDHDLDKNYLNLYLLQRVDHVISYTASVKKRFGYWNVELTGRQQQITPTYNYALEYDGINHTQFTANEASLNLRYAYAEHRAPVFGYYYSTGSKYPIWYGKITMGNLQDGTMQTPYTQAVSAILWHKHINRIGFEHFLLEGGKSWSENPLPLSKLFAANGYAYNNSSLYTFGGLMTITPYQFYTDRYVTFIFRHDFDWKLYTADFGGGYSSAPNISLGYNFLYGTLSHPEAQQFVNFSIPDQGYQEAGLLLNNIIRLNYLNLYYLSLNIGYFSHIASGFNLDSGRFVFGAGIDL